MELEIGIVCGGCDLYSALGTARCPSCGDDLALSPRKPGPKSVRSAPVVASPTAGKAASVAAKPASASVRPAPAASTSPAPARVVTAPIAVPPAVAPAPPRTVTRPAEGTAASRPPVAVPVGAAPTGALFAEPLRRRASPVPGMGGSVRATGSTSSTARSTSSTKLSQEELMDQAKHFVCRSCATPVPLAHKF